MNKVLIVFLSVTSANKVKSILERKYAVSSKVIQTPLTLGVSGCSYSLALNEKYLQLAWDIVKAMDLTTKGVYKMDTHQKIL